MKNNIMYGIVHSQNCINHYATQLRNKMSKEDGVTAIEYAVIAVAISTMLYAVFGSGNESFVTTLTKKFNTLSKYIEGTVD